MQRNSVISFKNKDKIKAIPPFKEEKNMLPLEWRYTFFSSKISKSIYILFLSCLDNCWSQSTRSKAISVFVLFTEVGPRIHLEKWMKLDWLPQDPQVFFPGWSWITLNGIWPIWSYNFFLYHAKKGKCVFFPKRLIMIISPWYISINFNVINNNFCVVDPFMLYIWVIIWVQALFQSK